MQPISFATIGTSHIAEVFLDAVTRTDVARIDAVYSRSAANGAAYAQKVLEVSSGAAHIESAYNSLEDPNKQGTAQGADHTDTASGGGCAPMNPRVITSFDELCSASDIEAVYVASPNTIHFEQALALIQAGKHVLVEKPFTPTAAEACTLMDAAQKAGVVCMEAMRTLHDPGFKVVRDNLDALGQIRDASIGYEKVSGRVERLRKGDVASCFDPRKAGGALMDLGCYMVEFAVALFGKPVAVKAAGTVVDVPGRPLDDPAHKVDLAGQALLEYADKIVHVFWGKTTDNHVPTQIAGEKATLLVTQASDPRKIELVRPAAISGDWGKGEGVAKTLDVPFTSNNIASELEDFAAAIRGEEAPVTSADEARAITLDSLEIMDEIRAQLGVVFG